MANQYGQTDILAQYLSAQPQRHHTGLGTALRLGGAALAAYGDKRATDKRRTALADALRGMNRGGMGEPGMNPDRQPLGPTMGAAAASPFGDPDMLAGMLMDKSTAPLAMAMIQRQMPKGPRDPIKMGPGEVLLGANNEPLYSAPFRPDKPKELPDGFQRTPDGQITFIPGGPADPAYIGQVAGAKREPDDGLITVPGVGVYDTRTQSYVGSQAAARQDPRMPGPSSDPTRGVPPKVAQDIEVTTYTEGLQALREEEAALESVGQMEAELDRFEQLMSVQDTGGVFRKYAPNSVQGALDAEIEEMIAISDRLTPVMRNGLPGAASDRDIAMFRGGTVGPDKKTQTNRNIIAGYRAQAENARSRLAFRQAYLDENRTLSGADEAWREYLEANPIFSPDSTPQNMKMNEGRMTWRQHFGLEETPEAAPKGDPERFIEMSIDDLLAIDPDTLPETEQKAMSERLKALGY